MKALIDGDILLHEIGWSCEFKDKDTGKEVMLGPDHALKLLQDKVSDICEGAGADEPPTLFLSDSEWLRAELNKRRKRLGEEPVPFVKGFRYSVANTKPYKGTRKNPKPFHFENLAVHILAHYDTVVSDEGYEADDFLAMAQVKAFEESGSYDHTIICSRDKDLRICPGWHYSWECGNQRSLGPNFCEEVGDLIETIKEKEKNGKIVREKSYLGYGLKFFYFQMMAGDAVDNIPGLPKVGKVAAYELLNELDSHEAMFKAVQSLYIEKMGKAHAKEYWLEQANLLWMVQHHGDRYSIPKFVTKS